MTSRGQIAFVDDEPDLCAAAADWLESSGFAVATWSDPVRALAEIDPARCDVVLTDLRMPDLPGDRLMAGLRARDADLPVILMSAHADVPVAVAAMREGAHDFIEKPYMAEYLVAVLDRAVEWRRLRREIAQARAPQTRRDRVDQRLIGRSPAMAHLREAVLQLADVPVDLLLTGDAGTGRETLARLIHDISRRARRQFVALDCAAIPEGALEAELFGHERGALPGTSTERASRFEFATGGTIYLAGIQALSSGLQARLIRVLQDRAVVRLGGNAPRPVDVRLIASTTGDLAGQARQGGFRQDLYFRLSSAGLRVPSLAERPEDIAALYAQFLTEAAARFRRPAPEPGPAEMEVLRARAWPGNLPQLQAAAERHVLGLRDDSGRGPMPSATPDDRLPLPRRVAVFEAQVIAEALARCGGSSAAAAELLGVPRRTLNEKIARYGLREGDGA
ncbi:two-component system, NtrC family, C4-dicarboxylate transport response regulator DctD [Gemmobacter megaterium]|uniref:Nif-specific regulatory protein n=1 Tax=Gemmobacter megaterium TaxID=1086013 RepID=A0A1N7NXH5_9RHOB|nr:sigma-54 dependent transcriptional regulator [Gemmobacter megaterium]GGE16054.1 sigma-54-dependent Fis family transcriptional regulator [Gemmobacter megaterium]SIT02939.1 two-component system, NtrC family, C4-dicarboxylate transport response regulator DctD [Gemmobacter megaterium]